MPPNNVAGLIHRNPDVAIFDGADAETLARHYGILESLRQRVHAAVAQSGAPQRMVATYAHEHVVLGAIYWHGFAAARDNGLICCIGRCTAPEQLPLVLLKLSEFFSLAICQHPCPWTVN